MAVCRVSGNKSLEDFLYGEFMRNGSYPVLSPGDFRSRIEFYSLVRDVPQRELERAFDGVWHRVSAFAFNGPRGRHEMDRPGFDEVIGPFAEGYEKFRKRWADPAMRFFGLLDTEFYMGGKASEDFINYFRLSRACGYALQESEGIAVSDVALKKYVYDTCAECSLDYFGVDARYRSPELQESFLSEFPFLVGKCQEAVLDKAKRLGEPKTVYLWEEPDSDNLYCGGRVKFDSLFYLKDPHLVNSTGPSAIGFMRDSGHVTAFVVYGGSDRAFLFVNLSKEERADISKRVFDVLSMKHGFSLKDGLMPVVRMGLGLPEKPSGARLKAYDKPRIGSHSVFTGFRNDI